MTMKQPILVVDDDPKVVEIIRLYLQRDQHQVIVAYDGLEAFTIARKQRLSLAILDWLLPSIDGLDLCHLLRAETRTPIILLTAKATEEDILRGLSQGADDYLTKPFRPRELVARVRAVLRRAYPETGEPSPELSVGDLVINVRMHEVRLQGKPVLLTPTEFKLLEMLMQEPGRVFTREEFIRRVFGDEYEGVERTMNVHLMNLRRKIEPRPDAPTYIETVFGVGYRFRKEGFEHA